MRICVFLLFILFSVSFFVYAGEEENKEYLKKIQSKIRNECDDKKGAERLNCIVDNTPEKCKVLAYNPNLSGWQYCVYTCGSEGFYSRIFGECSN